MAWENISPVAQDPNLALFGNNHFFVFSAIQFYLD